MDSALMNDLYMNKKTNGSSNTSWVILQRQLQIQSIWKYMSTFKISTTNITVQMFYFVELSIQKTDMDTTLK